jgi:hypothetical protein
MDAHYITSSDLDLLSGHISWNPGKLRSVFPPSRSSNQIITPSYALSLLCTLNVVVEKAGNSTVQSSFYIQPSIPHFNHSSKNYGYPKSRKPEGALTDSAFELSLRSTQGAPALSDVPHITMSKLDGMSTDRDGSNAHVSAQFSPAADQPGPIADNRSSTRQRTLTCSIPQIESDHTNTQIE